jgi:hypothetical protein
MLQVGVNGIEEEEKEDEVSGTGSEMGNACIVLDGKS